MSDLRERLNRLAEGASGDLDAAQLWTTGRRRHSLRTAAGALAVLLIATVSGLGGATLWSRTATTQLPSTSQRTESPWPALTLPDRFVTPTPWLPGTDQAGPIGPLSAVVGGARRSWRGLGPATTNGLAGVSARTGEYRFLDLPGYSPSPGRPALSADGRRLAYWQSTDASAQDNAVTGLAVYDTVSGTVRTHRFDNALGTRADTLVWVGETLWFSSVKITSLAADGSSSGTAAMWQWPMDAVARADETYPVASALNAGTPWGVVLSDDAPWDYSISDGRSVVRLALDRDANVPPVFSADGSALAAILQPSPGVMDSEPHDLLVGRLAKPIPLGFNLTGVDRGHLSASADLTVTLREVPGVKAQEVRGWRDASHVVVERYEQSQARLLSVDIRTGASTPLSRIATQNRGPGTIVADDAWQGEIVPASPGAPTDPRWTAASIAGAVLLGLWGTRFVRRRRAVAIAHGEDVGSAGSEAGA